MNPGFNAEMFGAAMGELIHETVEPLQERIKQLEERIEGMQKALDATRKGALAFAGDWQSALSYPQGTVVRFGGAIHTAVRDITPGKAEPNRQGSGWERLV